jgi:D-alanyl-D-alanine carboxypeptidase
MLIVVLSVLAVLVVGVVAMMILSSSPLDKAAAVASMRALVQKGVASSKDSTATTVRIQSSKLGLDELFAFEKDGSGAAVETGADQPFHVASIGKTCTAVLVMQLVEEGNLGLDQVVVDLLDSPVLEGLFVFEGTDYADRVTVRQLLDHTSGVADYFDDPVDTGEKASALVLTDPTRDWTPAELIAFSRDHQKAVGKPGSTYHYSDTGYVLLGLIVEQVSGKPFERNLAERIFVPLGMDDSYLLYRSEPVNLPAKPIAKIWLSGVEVSTYRSLSVDWAGGGIVSTTADLLSFCRALNDGTLVSAAALTEMSRFDHRFRTGIHTGAGLMQLRFEEFFPLLAGYPRMTGHIGVLSTFLFYDAVKDAVVVMNYGSNAHMETGFRNLIQIEGTLARIR